MKIIKKIIMTLVIITISTFPFMCKVNAEGITPSGIIKSARDFLDESEDKNIIDDDKGRNAVDQIYYMALGVAVVLAFLLGTILGIQFITSGAVGQAKVKEKIIPYVIGMIAVFGAFGIWRVAYNFINNFL